jgi:hypothetical protein
MSRARRPRLALLAAAFVMCDLLRRIFGDFRPVDWVSCTLELLFILVVLWLEVPEVWHKHTVRKKVRIVQRLLLDGNKFQLSAPPKDFENAEVISQWSEAVRAWIDTSQQTLTDNSIPAGLAFSRRNVEPDVLYRVITPVGDAREMFRELLHRMNNLLNIMEKADVYF